MSGTVNERHSPKSDFLCMVANDEVPLTGSETAEHNLRLLIGFTRDLDVSNRDWATMLLAQQEINTPEVRQALLVVTVPMGLTVSFCPARKGIVRANAPLFSDLVIGVSGRQ